MSSTFDAWMIVYTKSNLRVQVFNNINKKLNLNIFPAIDSIHEFSKYENLAIYENYCTNEYINVIKKNPGKLGCNLSHQMLLDHIYLNSKHDWNLILEDDIDLDESFINSVQDKLEDANKNNSYFIQLYTHPKFFDKQKERKKISTNLYEKIFQWGTPAYLIHKKAIPLFKKNYPLDVNIDIAYGKMISKWNSLCWLNNGIVTIGSIDNYDEKSKLGSIIYGKNPI